MIKEDYSYEDYGSDEHAEIQCYCQGYCPTGEEHGVCHVTYGGKCFALVEAVEDDYGDDYPLISYGCFGAGGMGLMQCKANLVPHTQSKIIQCCDDSDFCNKKLFPVYQETAPGSCWYNLSFTVLVTSLVSCFFIVVLVVAIFIMYVLKEKAVKEAMNPAKDSGVNNNEPSSDIIADKKTTGNSTDLTEQSTGSGSGLPMMVQRTIAKQIELGVSIGKGRFGEVWLGKWREEEVAVKVFLSTEEKSWCRETDVYQTVLMRHENILGYIASDIRGGDGWTQLLLITDYHERGSLYDFLQENTLNPNSVLTMCLSISRGLNHLHTEIFGIHGKPSIAHRDIKSKNILVKGNGECCIADFGLALKFYSSSNSLDDQETERFGTKRYMAPEILDGKIHLENYDSHKLADMYSCGLVFWEIARRCDIGDGVILDYAPPFHDQVPIDPSFDEMQEVVCVKKIRPDIPESWDSVEILKTLSKIMQELWHDNSAARLTSLRVKKTLHKLSLSKDVTIDIE